MEQQTTNRQHAIPQSIMSVEFKIIGDLTLKQFVYLLVFCGLAYASFMLVKSFIIKWSLVVACVGTGLAFAFLPLGDRGLDVWIVNFIRAMFAPNQYIYKKDEPVPSVFLYQNIDVVKNELIALTPTSSRRRIEEYLKQQEQKPDKLDIDEKAFILKVKQAYSQPPSVAKEETMFKQTLSTDQKNQITTQQTPQSFGQVQQQKEPITHATDNLLPNNINASPSNLPTSTTTLTTPTTPNALNTSSPTDIIKPPTKAYVKKPKTKSPHEYSPSITPDMRAGRIFINLSQNAEKGEIILPIRGERVIKTDEEVKLEEAEKQKIESLNKILSQISKGEQKTEDKRETPEEIEKEKIQKLENEIQKIVKTDTNITDAINTLSTTDAKTPPTSTKQEEALEYALTQQDRLAKLRETKIQDTLQEKPENAQSANEQKTKQTIPLTISQIKEWPTTPNVVWGVVVKEEQNQNVGVGGVVVVIRNQRGEVVRAVKTSAMGRFGITTPLINGTYTIEVDREKKSGLNFPVVSLEAKGEIIPTIEIKAQA